MDSLDATPGVAARAEKGSGVTSLRAMEDTQSLPRNISAGRRGWLEGMTVRGMEWRLFLTLWLVYLLHVSAFVTREQYLTMALVEDHSVRVDKYAGLHPDLITIPGRGTYLGNNPGISLLAAIPYAVAYPAVRRIAPVRPPAPGEEVKAETKEQRPMRLAFYKKVRQRGLDVRLAVVALFTAGFFMAPITAAGAVLLFRMLRVLGHSPGQALGFSLLFGLGTPMFFRAATMNQNLLVALLGLAAFALLWWPWETPRMGKNARYFLAGLLAGWAVLSDYTGVVTLLGVGLFALVQELSERPAGAAIRQTLWSVAGGALPGLFMLLWQWLCFGNPWYPAQYYLPKEVVAGYPSAFGFGWPLPTALWGLLFDPLYGLLVFAPIFALAAYHPVLRRRGKSFLPRRVVWFTWIFSAALWLFCSCIHYTVRHQWQDGVRYIVPAVPFLFLLVAEVLRQTPRIVVALVALAAVGETWCLSMVRENPVDSIVKVLLRGFELPWLTTLVKTASQYYPPLADGASPAGLFLFAGIAIACLWCFREPWKPVAKD
jgi:hypothetical protein